MGGANRLSVDPAQVLPTDWLLFDGMVQEQQEVQLCCCSVVTAATVALFSGGATQTSCSLEEEPQHLEGAAAGPPPLHTLDTGGKEGGDDSRNMVVRHWSI